MDSTTMRRQRLVITFVLAMTLVLVGYMWSVGGGPLDAERFSGVARADATLWIAPH